MNSALHKIVRPVAVLTLIVTGAGALSGCAADSVEVNLPFVGNVMQNFAKSKEPRLAKRGPLVLPPNAKKLPSPDAATQNAAQNGQLDWPDDPDLKKRKVADIQQAAQKKYQRDGNLKTYQGVDEFEKNLDWSARQEGVFKKWTTSSSSAEK